jgi:hypothetical protein
MACSCSKRLPCCPGWLGALFQNASKMSSPAAPWVFTQALSAKTETQTTKNEWLAAKGGAKNRSVFHKLNLPPGSFIR